MPVNVQEIIARIGTGFTAIEKRVLKVLPAWKQWPRRLRKVYILLGTYGSSNAALREMCDEFGWDANELKEQIEQCKDFYDALQEYREEGAYPEIPQSKRNSRLTTAQLNTLYTQEAAMIQFMHLEDAKAQGKAGTDFAIKLILEAGMLDIVENVSERPEIKHYFDQQKEGPGVLEGHSIDNTELIVDDGLPDFSKKEEDDLPTIAPDL
tara:strand:- start:2445 stop:3071 length:627 start_codon:yes stop_codon:yes gene_type:complete